jgi:hypothetical protein
MRHRNISIPGVSSILFAAALALLGPAGSVAQGQVIQPPYDSTYTLTDLGAVPSLPTPYGGLDFLPGNPNVIVIGGTANAAGGQMFTIGVVRDPQNHITSLSGSATFFSDGAFNDGGVVFGPGNVLFYTRFPNNEIGEVKPGSTTTDKIVALDPLSIGSSVGALNFVPAGFPGAGQMKIVSYDTAQWYTAAFSADGTGTYNITSATLNTTIQGGPEGFVYVPTGSPIFPASSMLVSEYGADVVSIYQFDSGANPVPASRTIFINGLTGAEGAVIDPITGDFLFSTFGSANHVIVVKGFVPPAATPTPTPVGAPTATRTPPPTPIPGGGPVTPVPTLSFPMVALMAVALIAIALLVLRRSP